MTGLIENISQWLRHDVSIESAVLFGSSAMAAPCGPDADFDVHVITALPAGLERVDWAHVLPGATFQYQAGRTATGGVRKVTALFAEGKIDLVIVPVDAARLIASALASGAYRQRPDVTTSLNEMATCLKTGYRFLKGEEIWGPLYASVAREMPGVRLSDDEMRALADAAVIDFLWAFEKVERGELVAAQHVLHRQLSETNLRLFRELRLRRREPLPSFGLGRRVETLASSAEVNMLMVSARLDPKELIDAATHTVISLMTLMRQLVPDWTAPVALITRVTGRAVGFTPAP